MGIQNRVKPISYLKANSAEIMRDLGQGGAPFFITQNGEAKAVLQDVGSYEETQETLALLKLLALGRGDIAAGRTAAVEGLAERIRKSG
jgi:prevent-host-death family protein